MVHILTSLRKKSSILVFLDYLAWDIIIIFISFVSMVSQNEKIFPYNCSEGLNGKF